MKRRTRRASGHQIHVEVLVETPEWLSVLPDAEALAKVALRIALLNDKRWPRKAGLQVDLTLHDDEAQRALNLEWRGKDKSTNVLSFPLESLEDPAPADRPRQLGDITLALQTVVKEARELQKPLSDHFMHLVIHGGLHLLGYDHIRAKQAEEMEALETKLLSRFRIPDPYAGEDSTKLKKKLK